MATATTALPTMNAAPSAMTYQQAMQNLSSMAELLPSPSGVVVAQPGVWASVNVQAGQHYKLRRLAKDGNTLETPDNVLAVRHGDALHLRYADGSTVSFEQFFSTCKEASVCSVNLASDSPAGMTLDASFARGSVADDGLLLYAHGQHDVLMAMAQDQPPLISALRALDDMEFLTYLPPAPGLALLAFAGLSAAGFAESINNHSGSSAGSNATISRAAALNALRDAAQTNTAGDSTTGQAVYVAAGVSGVTTANLSAINSALNSLPVTGTEADTTPEVQAIVDAYNAVLTSADGWVGNTSPPIPATQYTLLGVTGVTGAVTPGSALFLLDNTVDSSRIPDVDTVIELQRMADAAARVLAEAGGTGTGPSTLTLEDLTALGIDGVDSSTLPGAQTAIKNTVPDTAIDTQDELQRVVNTALGTRGAALNQIAAAADANNASPSSPDLTVYAAAAVTGVTSANLPEISSALDSLAITGAQANTTARVQTIVNAYQAIINSADGVAGNTSTLLSGAQYMAIGVTGSTVTAPAGSALALLDNVVDAIPLAGVDTVAEVQTLADAAAHVMTGAAGGSGPSVLDLTALGISGVTTANLTFVQTAIAATVDDGSGVDTRPELQAVVTAAINAISTTVAHTTSQLAGIANLDVSSNLVLSSDQSLTVGTGQIHITDLGGTGYRGDATTNTQTIDVATAVASGLLTITGTGANTKIVINPLWDLDLASNYQLSIDDGAFLTAGSGLAAAHFAPISFSTVTPGTHSSGTAASEAAASQTMVDATGALAAGKRWMDIEGLGNNTGPVTQLGDLSGGAYALVMKNYATLPGGSASAYDGIATHDTNVGVVNFGANDIVYFDSQVNNSATQFFDARYTSMTDGANVGGLAGQNTLVMGLTNTPQQNGSTAMILLGLEGNTANTLYSAIVSLPDGTVGWANVWHPASAPVVMG